MAKADPAFLRKFSQCITITLELTCKRLHDFFRCFPGLSVGCVLQEVLEHLISDILICGRGEVVGKSGNRHCETGGSALRLLSYLNEIVPVQHLAGA